MYVKLGISLIGRFIGLYPDDHPVKKAGKEAIEYARGQHKNFMLISEKFLKVIELAKRYD